MKLALALFFAFVSAAFAAESDQSYRIDGQSVLFVRGGGEQLLVSGGCLKSELLDCACHACEAPRSFRRVTLPPTSDGRNPGAVLCRAVGGLSIVGLDSRGDERGFCRFGDGSLVTNGSLYASYRRARRR